MDLEESSSVMSPTCAFYRFSESIWLTGMMPISCLTRRNFDLLWRNSTLIVVIPDVVSCDVVICTLDVIERDNLALYLPSLGNSNIRMPFLRP